VREQIKLNEAEQIMGLEKKKEESKSSHVRSSPPPICMLYSDNSSSSSNKVNKVTFGYHVLLDEAYFPSKTMKLTPPTLVPQEISLASQQSLPSQPSKAEPFVELLISKRALVCSLLHPLPQAKGYKAIVATQTKMTFLAKQVSISQEILIDATTETNGYCLYI
jgi:hypothetical protein